MKRLVKFLLILLPTVFFFTPAVAQTPDGETPASEGVCDVLVDHTPGLYGLCVAYCEAHDADLLSPGGDPHTLDTPNRKILENYRKRMGAGDPDMPCVQDPCPCWDFERFDHLTSTAESCFAFDDTGHEHDSLKLVDSPIVRLVETWHHREGPPAHTGLKTCSFIDRDSEHHTGLLLEITDEEYIACRDQIEQRGTELGLPCSF